MAQTTADQDDLETKAILHRSSQVPATFINITHPSQRKEAATKKQVAQYIGVHFRNRSRPVGSKQAKPSAGNGKPGEKRELRALAKAPPIASTPWVDRDRHGLRSDPFGIYPSKADSSLMEAIDFFMNAYGPTHIQRRSTAAASSLGVSPFVGQLPVVQRYFQYSLQHPAMFEAIIALSLSHLRIHLWQQGQPDQDTVRHYGSALQRLHQSIQDEGNNLQENAVFFTILALMDLEYLMGNLSAYDAHASGLRKLVSLRGGLSALSWCDVTHPAVKGTFALWRFLRSSPDDTAISGPDRDSLLPQRPEPNFLNTPDPTTVGRTYLGPGITNLIQSGKLSGLVAAQFHEVYSNWQNVDLFTFSPFHKTAANMELRELGWGLLNLWQTPDHGGLTMADYILLITLQHTLLDLTHAERYSPLYTFVVSRWVSECSTFLETLDRDEDPATTDLLVYLCMKLSGSLVATFLKAQSGSRHDPRFQLVVKMMEMYPETRIWKNLEDVVRRFPASDYCIPFWHNVWKLVLESGAVDET